MKKQIFLLSLSVIVYLTGLIKVQGQTQCQSDFQIIKDSSFGISPYVYLFMDKSPVDSIFSWEWTFGDSITSTEQYPLHEYAHSGTYNVCLTIKTGTETHITCENTYCSTLVVDSLIQEYCTASFYYYNYTQINDSVSPGSGSGNTFYFIDNSQGNIFKRTWDFGDGTTSNEQNPEHTFNPGHYDVCLEIDGKLKDLTFCQDNYCLTIDINQTTTCYADFFQTNDPIDKTSFNFYDASTGNPEKWYWDFGDNTSSSQQYPFHKYEKAGTYNVCLTIINDSLQCKDMKCYTIFAGVSQNNCEAIFTYQPDSLTVMYSYSFINLSKGAANKFLWEFDDNTFSTEENPSHVFPGAGVYNVCLTIYDSIADGCFNSYCKTIFVGEKPSSCNAHFTTYQDTSVTTPNFIRFTDISNGNPVKWFWDFGDNNTDTIQSPTHAYSNQGVYYPCLTITNEIENCKDVYCSQVFVGGENGYCNADFSYKSDQSVVTLPYSEAFYFIDNSQGNISSWYWTFGDGTSSNEKNPTHIFNPGNYKICLTITSITNKDLFCSDTYCSLLVVDSISPPPSNYCSNYFTYKYNANDTLTINFKGNAINSESSVKYLWHFGDGDSSITQNPVHTYKHSGSYTVTLKTNDSIFCKYTSSQTINIGLQKTLSSISGQIFADRSNVDEARVIIGSFDFTTNSFTYIDTSYVDSIGEYRFNKLPYGTYHILALLLPGSKYYNEYVPTYYGDSWNWESSKTIEINELTLTVQYDIHLIPYQNFISGNGSISGYVTYGGIKPFKKNFNLSGIEVLLLDLSDRVLDFTLTDFKGNYKFSNLAYGTYKVYVEIWGMNSTAALVTISQDKENETDIGFNVNYFVTPFSIKLSTNNTSTLNAPEIGDIYPNPLNNKANIRINLTQPGRVNMTVYNSVGQLVNTYKLSEIVGAHTLHLDVSDLPNGLYSILVAVKDNANYIRRFVKTDIDH